MVLNQEDEVTHQETEEPDYIDDTAPITTQVQAASPAWRRPKREVEQFERPYTWSKAQAPELSSSW